MTRRPRIVVPGKPHHLTQRGNNKQQAFFSDEDRQTYLRLLKRNCKNYGTRIMAYCLMPNHIHLIAIPGQANSFAFTMQQTQSQYTRYLNRERDRVGHLWQSRYYSVVLDETHLVHAMRYVERNPVRARLAIHAWEYPWSSAAFHCGGSDPPGLLTEDSWADRYDSETWRSKLRTIDENDLSWALNQTVGRGRNSVFDLMTQESPPPNDATHE